LIKFTKSAIHLRAESELSYGNILRAIPRHREIPISRLFLLDKLVDFFLRKDDSRERKEYTSVHDYTIVLAVHRKLFIKHEILYGQNDKKQIYRRCHRRIVSIATTK